jgi:hypothetical protein
VSDGLDLGEAADYILAERRGLDEDAVWAVLNELGAPPEKSQDRIALELIARARPDVRRKDAKRVIAEWRAYAELEQSPDWDDLED